ncbi:MAG: AAA family ATPase [Rhizobiales bacterium]|nr:AAA family ATPase [Hyphomicrobiales bacterium]
MLIIFGGRSGTGKTALSRALARHLDAVHVRIDTIEEAIANDSSSSIGGVGYRVGYAVAEDNLRLGRIVVADSVNPLDVTRDAWRSVADRAGVPSIEVEIVCSDTVEHRRRVEQRVVVQTLSWQEVVAREIQPWTRDHIVIDTAGRTIEDCLAQLTAAIAARGLPAS